MDRLCKDEITENHRKTAEILKDKVNAYLVTQGDEPDSVLSQDLDVCVGRGELGPEIRTWYRLTDNSSMPYSVWVAETADSFGFVVTESVDGEY